MLSRLLIAISVFIWVACSSQSSQSEKLLIGTWQCTKTEMADGNELNFEGKPYYHDFIYQFTDEGVFHELNDKTTFRFEVIGDTMLYINREPYVIEKISDTDLVLKEYDEDLQDLLWGFRRYFVKIKKQD